MLLQAAGASDWDYLAATSDALSQKSSVGARVGEGMVVGLLVVMVVREEKTENGQRCKMQTSIEH